MLSSVLKSTQAARVNVEIMRAFVRLRGMALHIRELMAPSEPQPKRRIGFVSEASPAGYSIITRQVGR